jgi:L-rhamnose mutarotase
MHEALVDAGYTNYTIFRRGTTVCGYAECIPDVETVLAKIAANPVSQRWGKAMAGIAKRHLERATEVWRL